MTEVSINSSSNILTEKENALNDGSQNADATNNNDKDPTLVRYVFIGVLTVTLIVLLYYAYNRFVLNSIEEPMTKGLEQERDDPVVDFNLREAIRDLQGIQQKVLSSLSEIVNI